MTSNVLDGATPEHWQMVLDNDGLIWRHVNRLGIAEHERDDAHSDGVLGLLRAAMMFDPSRGYKFSTYADAWIVNGIQRGREQLEGCNFRRATRNGAKGWTPPASMDEVLHNAGVNHQVEWTLKDFIASDSDTEHEGVMSAAVTDALLAIMSECRDVVDLEVVALMAEGELSGGLEIARRHGTTRQAVSRRRARLTKIARTHIEVAA